MKISNREKEVFEFIKSSIENGYAPTVREICSGVGIKSTSTAYNAIKSLTENGLLEKSDKKNRTIRLSSTNSSLVPLVGTVTAGSPITAFEDIIGYINFCPKSTHEGELFALKVRGESMINAGILDGDTIIVEKSRAAQNGEIVVALCCGEDATVKRFYKENGHFRLQPENDSMDPIILDDVQIIGKVVGLIQYLN